MGSLKGFRSLANRKIEWWRMSFNLAKYVVLCRALAGQRFRVMKVQLDGEHQPLPEICLWKAEAAFNITDVFESRVSLWKREVFSIHLFLLLPLCGLTLPERSRDALVEHLPASVVRWEMQLLTNFTSRAAKQKQPVLRAKLDLGTVFNRGGKCEWFSTRRRNSLNSLHCCILYRWWLPFAEQT